MEALTDSLLNDLDDLSDAEDDDHAYVGEMAKGRATADDDEIMEGDDHHEFKTSVRDPTTVLPQHAGNAYNDSIAGTALWNGDGSSLKVSSNNQSVLERGNPFQSLLDKIKQCENEDDHTRIYEIILECNKQLSNLTISLGEAHSALLDAYKPKFPELEDLVLDPLKYKDCVKILQNEMDITLVNNQLNEILNSNQVLTISVAGSTTSGRILTAEELQDVNSCVQYIERLIGIQFELTQFVEMHMTRIAPNVSAIVGAAIAARVVGLAGGLVELSRIPSCNIQVLGQVKQNAHTRAGLSSVTTKPHMGIIAECELVSSAPEYLQRKVMKTVAAKLSLAARCDFINAEKSYGRKNNGIDLAASGRAFRAEIESKISKWQEPDKARTLKALPKPNLATKKRRGGKRVRRMKERFETTELQKQANKRSFNTQVGEYGDDAMGLTLGMLDSKDGGNLRQAVEKKKMKQANTKASRKKAAEMAKKSGATSGLVSSMVFTPVQGLELVNPDAMKDRVRDANKKWFSDTAGFQSALPKEE